ncbi:UDP-glucosyltransferase 2-like [Leptidea sinapis]|uniref:UDP-glucosyltransferase 2-like n=1 Tax=Leptidea sinapis TaxID=189913 RepID=UPI00214231DA|nr:UDP-glucosyltransferase 2-like [Leptidea sinapis]
MKCLGPISLILCAFISVNNVESLNILGIFPYPGKSHFFVFEKYLRELAARGHNVTVVSHFPLDKPIKNYYDISLAGKTKILEGVFPIERSYWTIFQVSWFLVTSGRDSCSVLLSDENVQNIWKDNSHFDVMVTEQFNSDCSLGLAYKLGLPVVGINSHVIMPWHYSRFGIPYNPSFVTFMFLDGGTKPTFYQRLERTIFNAYFNLLYKYFCQAYDQNTLAKYFDDIPPLEDLAREIKFLLQYTSFTLTGSSLLPANVIEVNGYHVEKPKSLPKDILKFIEESEHGVIYISFGSMLKAATTPKDKVEEIVAALSKLPQRVLWKWEDKALPGNPKNIYLSNWFPQNDILAHPKVLAFYAHCGLLGITEAIHHGVPILGMPIFGDQPANAKFVEESGLGVQIQVADLSRENLLKKFRTILNPEFRSKVKSLSKAWRDRPVSAMDSAVFWTEFAARYRNFTFTSPAATVPAYQYYALDILSLFFVIILTFILITIKILNSLLSPKKIPRNKTKKQ